MKKWISILLALCLLLALAACGGAEQNTPAPTEAPAATEAPATEAPAAETPIPEEPALWTREGFFGNENEYMLSVTWMEDVEEPGWYVGCMLGKDWSEDSWGGILPQEGNSLKGTLPSAGSKDPLTVTLTEEGEDGLLMEVEGGETYHFKPVDMPTATIFITVNVEGWGNIDYAPGEEAPEIDPDYPYQSAQINLAEPESYTFVAWPKAGSRFVKWTKNGEDLSADAQITLLLDESADYIAVFEEDPDWQNPVMNVVGEYQCDRAHALVECFGEDSALITIDWGSSAWELARWLIVGRLDPETKTIAYSGCNKSILTYGNDGELQSEETEYEDGTGTIVFNEDGTFTWHEDQSVSGRDMVFEWLPVQETGEDDQNPVMNWVGNYQSGRAGALVEAVGEDSARITIKWSGSAWEYAQWVIEGVLDPETRTIEYTGCVESVITCDGEGNIESETLQSQDGTGTIVFGEDLTFVWHNDQSDSETDMQFEWAEAPGIDYLALVNKVNPLPDGWEDALETVTITNSVGESVEVEAKAYAAYERLKDDLEQNDGVYLELDSARRSVAAQQDIMDRFIEKYGADYAAKTVAQPGYSEHHTGLALDLYFKIRNEDGSFTDVYYNEDMEKEEYRGIWDAIHAKLPRYGFILRYLEGEEHITGYRYEPWHIRYVDSEVIAGEIMSQPGYTLEEYLAGKSAPEAEIDLSGSALYTEEELTDAMLAIKCRFAAWGVCELHAIRYAGDEANSAENLEWLNTLNEGADYAQIAEFLMDFHTAPDAGGAWEQDLEYTDWQWWLARTEDGDWEIVTNGY